MWAPHLFSPATDAPYHASIGGSAGQRSGLSLLMVYDSAYPLTVRRKCPHGGDGNVEQEGTEDGPETWSAVTVEHVARAGRQRLLSGVVEPRKSPAPGPAALSPPRHRAPRVVRFQLPSLQRRGSHHNQRVHSLSSRPGDYKAVKPQATARQAPHFAPPHRRLRGLYLRTGRMSCTVTSCSRCSPWLASQATW
jgi:hypothetical protein